MKPFHVPLLCLALILAACGPVAEGNVTATTAAPEPPVEISPSAPPTVASPAPSDTPAPTAIPPLMVRGDRITSFSRQTEWSVESAAWSPDGKTLAGGSQVIAITWAMPAGKLEHYLWQHEGYIQDMAFSPDGRMLATSGQDDLIILWNAVEWTQLRTLRGHTNTVTRLAWSPDSTTLASISYDDTIRFWDAAGGQEVRRIANGRPMDIDWSNDGWFAVAMSDHTVAIYDSAGAAAQTLTGHAEMVGSVAFSPDGRFLISRSLKDYQMILWDTATWQPLLSIDAVDGPVLSLAWRPDNRLLAAGTYNDNLVLIDTRAGAIVHTFDGAIVHDLAWSPDGKVLAAGTGSGITVWDLSQALP